MIETKASEQRFFDVYRLNLKNGKCDLLEKNLGNVLDWFTDAQGAIRTRYVIKGTKMKIETRPSEQSSATVAAVIFILMCLLAALIMSASRI